ncbi:MAG: hypothetical protein AB7I41_10205 [Candidatus Sericytochromatia bacterium]
MAFDVPQAFIDACYEGDIESVKRFFAQGLAIKKAQNDLRIFDALMHIKDKELASLLVKHELDPRLYKNELPIQVEEDIINFIQAHDDGVTLAHPYPDADFIDVLITMGADINALRQGSCQTALDIALSIKNTQGECLHIQAVELLQTYGAKRASELSDDEWLERMNLTDLCRQGLLPAVQGYPDVSDLKNPLRFNHLLHSLTYWYQNIAWRGEHSQRDFEGVFKFIFKFSVLLQEINYNFAYLCAYYFNALLKKFRSIDYYAQYHPPFPPFPLDPYFPVFSLTRVMTLFEAHGAAINGVTEEDQYKSLTVSTALDYVLAAQAEARQLWEKEADRYSPALFARLTPRQQEVRLQERKPRQERLQRIMRDSEEALAFLIAHGAKTYSELSNETENA